MVARLPAAGLPWGQVRERMKALAAGDVDWRRGRAALYVFHPGDEVLEVAHEAYGMFISENGLAPSAFPSLAQMERDVVGMAGNLLALPEDGAGSMSSGGTESILLAVKACRDRARATARLPAGVLPRIVVPGTAHPAFEKAAQLLDLEVLRVPVAADLRADVSAMAQAIDARTIMLVGSAPCFPFGLVDPIAELSALALAHGLWLHVDACVGAFIAPFVRMNGDDVATFDFSLPGVTSMSGDLHKYGYASKGASVVLYRDAGDFAFQRFEADVWPMGTMGTPTLAGTRPGGAIASAWAVLHYLGEAGYRERARMVVAARRTLEAGVRALGLAVFGSPQLGICAFGPVAGDALDGDERWGGVWAGVAGAGWATSRTLQPRGIHLMLSPNHINVVDDYLVELGGWVDRARRGEPLPAPPARNYG
jgi:glutamate/tyrosine decarboxylase-like PLP-dependent enzyme